MKQWIVFTVFMFGIAAGCRGNNDGATAPKSVETLDHTHVTGSGSAAPVRDACQRAYDCCRAFWGAHEVLTADLVPADTDCHETRGVDDATCLGLVDRFTSQLSTIDVTKRPAVEAACR